MDTRSFLIQRQIHWATRHGIKLLPAKPVKDQVDHLLSRRLRAYTSDLRANLFEPLSHEARKCFLNGDGDELRVKMCAVHSSSAICANFFHYWLERRLLVELAKVMCIPSTQIASGEFECKRKVMADVDRAAFSRDPNLDFVFTYSAGPTIQVAVESKFTEPFGRKHGGLSRKYLNREELWEAIPNLRKLGEEISPVDRRFTYLHVAQLLKHVLGLLQVARDDRLHRAVRLFYLFYDVTGEEGFQHRTEIEQFARIVREQFPGRKPIIFQYMTYQEALMRLALRSRERHPVYLDWMLERYL